MTSVQSLISFLRLNFGIIKDDDDAIEKLISFFDCSKELALQAVESYKKQYAKYHENLI